MTGTSGGKTAQAVTAAERPAAGNADWLASISATLALVMTVHSRSDWQIRWQGRPGSHSSCQKVHREQLELYSLLGTADMWHKGVNPKP